MAKIDKKVVEKKQDIVKSKKISALVISQFKNLTLNQIMEVQKVADSERIPLSGITILGGRPYINVTGLDVKVKNKCNDENLILAGIEVEKIQHGTEENNWIEGRKATIRFFDKGAYQEALKKVKNIDAVMLHDLRDTFTYSFTDEGWATAKSCEGIAYEWKGQRGSKTRGEKLQEIVAMMASRRATNRAKREATGCGLTSTDELVTVPAEKETEEVETVILASEDTKKGIKRESEYYDEEIQKRIKTQLSDDTLTQEQADTILESLRKPIPSILKHRKPLSPQDELLYKILSSHVFSETDREIFDKPDANTEEKSDTIKTLQAVSAELHHIESSLLHKEDKGFKLDAGVLSAMRELFKGLTNEVRDKELEIWQTSVDWKADPIKLIKHIREVKEESEETESGEKEPADTKPEKIEEKGDGKLF